jgi:hypothetical protein
MSKQYLDNTQEQQSVDKAAEGPKQGASNSAQQDKMREAQFVAEYESALGSWLGPKLYDAVSDQITLDKMTGYGNKLVEALLKLGAGELGKANPAINDKLQQQIVQGISKELEPLVAKMMQSDTGLKLIEGLQNVVGSNPYGVASVAILAAAGAILADADIPTLKQKINLGKGFSTNLEANLGSFRNIAIGATKVGLAYQKENVFQAGVEISRSKEGDLSGSVSGQVGDNKRNIKGSVNIDEKGITAFDLSGLYALSPNTSLSGRIHGKDPYDIPNMEVQIKTEKGDFTHTGQLKYDSNSENLTAMYSGKSEQLRYQASLVGNTQGNGLIESHLGAKYTPNKGDIYSADYRYNFQRDDHNLDLMAQKRMGDFSLRGHQKMSYGKEKGLQSNTELMAAYHMGTDLSLIGGADINHDFQSGETVMLPKAGIQYKDVPITLSFDPRTKSTSVGITLKF